MVRFVEDLVHLEGQFVLDSGARWPAITQTLARELGYPDLSALPLHPTFGMGGPSGSRVIEDLGFVLFGPRPRMVPVPKVLVLPEDRGRLSVQGSLGMELFRAAGMRIRLDAGNGSGMIEWD
ncbi:MAG: hypothetical protein KGJ23_05450 [Euryarchaeota archaeon]|nr:hypothetical protein [Euryarchaeota archaeon]MDE1836043.1 hypothetical protein [Euryarchaeota archaeon]MDE1881225.1 hypothetical protein [Euryarchaeota archaeon]MDE2044021.1 hypothetical protein [Thermoplasmata archaeon]